MPYLIIGVLLIVIIVLVVCLLGALKEEKARITSEEKIRADGTISVQEAWEAAGGNPNIKATKKELIEALRTLDAVCDFCDANHRDTHDRTRN